MATPAPTPRFLRDRALKRLAEPFDLIVIGGGVNGCAVAWDASLRGLRVLLLEKDDLASGTSSWSSRLIHGGLKYLEKYDVRLVRESLREREWLLGAAPHLVHGLRMVVPFYEDNVHGTLAMRAAMLTYDALSPGKSLPHHTIWSREEILKRIPSLEREGLHGAAGYFDGQSELAERLAVETAVAARDQGATVLTQARVDSLVRERDGRVTGVELTDGLDGSTHRARAKVVMNVTGAWLDDVLDQLHGPKVVGGTKGSHFVVDPFPGAPEDALYYEAEADGRAMMVIPWLGQYLIGSTDERFTGDLDTIAPSSDEVDYILRETNRVLPGAGLTTDDLLWGYTGVRPLPNADDGAEGDITRRHDFRDHGPEANGLISLVGGKLTTFRQVGEDATDIVMRKLRATPKRSSATRRLRLPGGTVDLDGFRDGFLSASGLDEAVAHHLVQVYGTRAQLVAARAADDPTLREVVHEPTHTIAAEIAVALESDLAVRLTDVLARRLMIAIGPSVPDATVERVAELCQSIAGWSDERTAEDLDAFRTRLQRFRVPATPPQEVVR